jgi:asparagine synthase (glutamine-hydrolysing)
LLHCQELVNLLTESIERNRSGALLLSGGLDSSILASILHPDYSVTAGYGGDAPDFAHARQVAGRYSKKHAEVVFAEDKMIELVDSVIQVFKTFDPIEIRNSTVALAGIEQAKSDGYSRIMTGDGGDELFAGYNYLARYYSDPRRLEQELQRLWEVMHFSSKKLGEKLGIDTKTPFLDSEFASFAKALSVEEKVGEHAGKKWGKFVLRKCFESELGDLVWRDKMAQEQGAATDRFQSYIGEMIDDLTFANKARIAKEQDGVTIRSKEHLNYYAIFRSYFPPPKEESKNCELHCPQCQACFKTTGRFCRTCGAFPVTPVSL